MNSVFTITDFPDSLSPMVVKELRQWLRTRLFGGVMVVLHTLLVLFTLMSGGEGDTSTVTLWFDGIITLVLCLILPLRGFSAVADELKGGTLDMLALTRLSAGRIVFGKWASIVSQSLLIALSILPYVVARYVFGGLDLFEEVTVLFYKWLGGAVAAAVIIALSTQRQFWLRAVVVGLPLLMCGCGLFSFFMMRSITASMAASGGSSTVSSTSVSLTGFSGGVPSLPLLIGVAAWAIFFCLSLAATRIAPSASLLAVVKRSVNLAALLILLLLAWTTSLSSIVMPMAVVVVTLTLVDVLTERVNEVPSVYAAFYKRGWAGRVALALLAPGWATGFLFSLLLVSLLTGITWLLQGMEQALLLVVSACGTWMIAALVQILPTRRARDLFVPFLMIWLVINVLLSVLASLLMMPFAMKSTTAWFLVVLPEFVAVGHATAQATDKEAFLNLGTLISLAWPVLLMVLAVLAWRGTKVARVEAWKMTNDE